MRSGWMRGVWAGVLLFASTNATAQGGRGVEYLGAAKLPGDLADRSGLTDMLEGNLPHNLVGSFGSGLVYSGRGDVFYACADRGPADGAFAFRDRFHTLSIVVRPGETERVRVKVEGTSLLTGADARPYVGSAAAFNAEDQRAAMRLDPEGIAVSGTGTVWTCDEYGPWLDEWTLDGRHVRRVETPTKFRVAKVGGSAADELPPNNTSGRQANRGLEGLTFSPDGQRLYAMMQGPLLQDHALDDAGKRFGINVRLLEWRIDAGEGGGAWREYLYLLDDASHGVNEIMAVGDGQFLVIEKDGKPGLKAEVRKIYRVELAGATDVSAIASLPGLGLPPGVRPVSKTLLLDMLDPAYALAGPEMPEKVEGLALGPDLADGRKLLLVASDNDYDPGKPSWVWAFAVEGAVLNGSGAGTVR